MRYKFTAKGHKNILSAHKKTFEFTKDKSLTKNGDCIIGVEADFILSELNKFLSKEKVKIIIKTKNSSEIITAKPNPKFSGNYEMVIRLSDFDSERTFAVHADKAAVSFNKRLVEDLKNPEMIIEIVIE